MGSHQYLVVYHIVHCVGRGYSDLVWMVRVPQNPLRKLQNPTAVKWRICSFLSGYHYERTIEIDRLNSSEVIPYQFKKLILLETSQLYSQFLRSKNCANFGKNGDPC